MNKRGGRRGQVGMANPAGPGSCPDPAPTERAGAGRLVVGEPSGVAAPASAAVMPATAKSEIGSRFGRLLVLEFVGQDKRRLCLFRCLCDCGVSVIKKGYDLRRKSARSCGCLRRENTGRMFSTHGHCRERQICSEYHSWSKSKDRCTNANNPDYHNYGGRGIKMCQRWLDSFESFMADMGPKPSKSHSIERIDVNGHYSPENCEWGTPTQQARNRRISCTVGGIHINEIAERIGISKKEAYKRFRSGTLVP
jgi:hypothetical protein